MEEKEKERIAKLEEATKLNTYRISKLENTNEALLEFKAIVKMQAEISKSQEETLDKINVNLTEINHTQIQYKEEQKKIREDMREMTNKVKEDMNEVTNKVKEMESNNKIDIPNLLNKIFVAGIMGYVLLQFGLK